MKSDFDLSSDDLGDLSTENDFIHQCGLKNKASSNIIIQNILSSLALTDVGVYLRDGPLRIEKGIVNLHPIQDSQRVLCTHKCYFDSYGITPLNNLYKNMIT